MPSTENVQTIDQFIAKHGIKFECRRVDSRPDGLGDWDKAARHFRCRISYTPKLPSGKEYVSLNECNPRSWKTHDSKHPSLPNTFSIPKHSSPPNTFLLDKKSGI